MSYTYCCACCESATFEHPDVEECESVDGKCEHLVRAGWRPVWLRGYLDGRGDRPDKQVFARGGWICHECVRRLS